MVRPVPAARSSARTLSLSVPVRVAAAALATGLAVVAVPATAWGAGGFTSGDLVIYQVGGQDSTSYGVSLVDYSTAGMASGYAVALPTTPGTPGSGNQALVESGSATYDGELTLSADGHSLLATGYDAATGVTKITSAAGVPRTVAVVDASGNVDTTTALTDANSEGPSTAPNNFRSAASVDGSTLWTGGDGGVETAAKGATAATQIAATAMHQVEIYGGQLYGSLATGSAGNTIVAIGSGLPGSSPATLTPLPGEGSWSVSTKPTGFGFTTLGSTSGADTLYLADTGNNKVVKFSLVNGSWVQTGSVSVPIAAELVVSSTGGVATIYVTGGSTTTAKYNSVLYKITDSSGYDGTLSGTAATLASAPAGTAWKGVAFAPTVSVGTLLPESPLAVGLPVAGLLLLAGYGVSRRRSARTA